MSFVINFVIVNAFVAATLMYIQSFLIPDVILYLSIYGVLFVSFKGVLAFINHVKFICCKWLNIYLLIM